MLSVRKAKPPVDYFCRWFFILFLIHFCCTSRAQNISIKGKIEAAGQQYIFVEYFDGTKMVKDSTISKNGYFAFYLEKSADQQFAISLDKKHSFSFFYTEPMTKVYIDLPINRSYVENPSENQLDYLKHQRVVNDFMKRNQYIFDTNIRLQRVSREKNSIPIKDSLRRSENEIWNVYQKRLDLEFGYLKDNPRSFTAIYTLAGRSTRAEGKSRLKDFIAVYNSLPEDIKETYYGKRFQRSVERLKKINAVNVPLTDFRAVDIDNDTVSISRYRGKKYVLIDFWASWCIPCRSDHPKLIELYDKYNALVEFISISLDTNLNAWKKAIKEDQIYRWVHLTAKENTQVDFRSEYDVKGVPVRILLDSDGKIIKRWQGQNEEYIQDLANILKTLSK